MRNTNWFVGLLGISAFVLAQEPAQAQFFAQRPNASYYFNQNVVPNYGGYGNFYNYNLGFRINHVNPVTGQRFSFNWNEGAVNAFPGAFGPSVFNNFNYSNGYMSGGYGYNPYASGYGTAYNPYAGSGSGAYKPYTNSDRAGAVDNQANFENNQRRQPAKLDVDLNQLLDPNEELLLSGEAHNQLVALIAKLEKTNKAESPLLPGGIVDQIDFVGGPAAAILAVLKGGKPVFPEVLGIDANKAIKADLEAALQPVADAHLTGTPISNADATRLTTSVSNAKKKLADTVRNLGINDGLALTRFLNGLEGVARSTKDPKLNGVYVARWRVVGPTVSELVAHMEKYQLQVGPAHSGEADAYATLHRGLASYYLGLANAKK